MNFVSRRFQESIRVIAATTLATALSVSLPLSAFAQEGVVARENRVALSQSEKATDSTQKKDDAKSEAADADGMGIVKIDTSALDTPAPLPAGSPQDPNQNPITRPLALSPDIGTQRVGVDPNQVQNLVLQDAIAMALQNNLDIESFRQGVQISQYSLFASEGVYDINSSGSAYYRSQSIPVSSIFQGGGATSSFTQKSIVYNFSTSKNAEKGGGFYQVDFNNSRSSTSSTAATLSPQYNPSLALTFTQPLMRDFKIDANRRNIQVAKKQLDLSDSQFRQRVIDIISSVQRAYWDLHYAVENEKIARKSVDLTLTQLNNNQKQVEAGTLAPIELRSTEAALESRKSDVIVAMQGITTAENTLKGLLLKDLTDKLWNAQLLPTDQPNLNPPQFNLEEATTLALKNRPELEQLRLQAQQKEIDLDFYQNQSKPQVDLVGIYGNTGLAGAPSNVGNVPERFQGGYFSALRNLFSQDFRTYQVGVTISFPWKNKIAEANIGRTLAETRQLDARQRSQAQAVQIEVRNALQAVQSARQRFEAQRAARIAAEAQLKGEVEKFRAGLSTNFFVLQRQTDLAIAEGNESRALTDYNKALADLQRATGMTLTINNIQVAPAVSQAGKK